MDGGVVAEVEWAALATTPGSARTLLQSALAVRASGFATDAESLAWAQRVYLARPFWNEDFGGEQFSLGRAWYTHLEEDRSREYFAGAAESNSVVERALPGLAARMVDAVARVVGEAASVRPGWCGPGVHVFPAGEHVSRSGGVVHFDTEGLSERHAATRAPALTLVWMLQPPIAGGELAVWDVLYDGEESVDDEILASAASATIVYEAGSLVVLDSYRLHQIRPFAGGRDRISVTAHAARAPSAAKEGWEVWF